MVYPRIQCTSRCIRRLSEDVNYSIEQIAKLIQSATSVRGYSAWDGEYTGLTTGFEAQWNENLR